MNVPRREPLTTHEYAKALLALPDMPLMTRGGLHDPRLVLPVAARPEVAYGRRPGNLDLVTHLCGPGDEGAVRIALVSPADPRREPPTPDARKIDHPKTDETNE